MSADPVWDARSIARSLKKAKSTPTGWKACCPAHEDNNPSLFIADGKDGKGVAMVCYAGCTYQAIAQSLQLQGIHLTPRHDQSTIPTEHYHLGEYHSHWDYRDAHGIVIMRVCRWEKTGGGKEIRPLVLIDDKWEWKHYPGQRPLFNLDRLAANPDAPVVLVEGEKTALAAQKLYPDHIATTWPGGAQSMGQVDWAPLQGRTVIAVPDCDAPGRKAMQWVAQQLAKSAKSFRQVDPSAKIGSVPEGWDLADALHEGRDVSGWLAEPTPDAPATYPLTWFGDIEGPINAEQVVEDLLVEGSFFVVYGESNSGKTFFIMDLALSVAQGIAWRGKATRKGLVIYVAGEGASSVKNRVAAYRKARPFVSGASPFAIVSLAVDFMDAAAVHKLVETIKAAQAEAGEAPALVIVDTLARAMAGGEENSTLDMGLVVQAADRIRAETSAAVGFVHHSGKDAAKGARGSSALRAATDTEIMVEGTKGTRTVSVMKQRDLDMGDKLCFDLQVVEIGTNQRGKIVTSCVVNHLDENDVPTYTPEPSGKNPKRLLTKLRELTKEQGQKPYTVTELRRIAQDTGMVKSSAVAAVDMLVTTPFFRAFGGAFVFTDGEG